MDASSGLQETEPELLAENVARNLPNQRLGDYELLQEIACGGMGIVYRARQRSLNRVVALKVIRPGGEQNETWIRRFGDEARAVASLQHPHIVAIYDIAVEGQTHFFSMEYLPGGSLADWLVASDPSPQAIARCVILVAEAVHHAHERGILHRDLKPSNVLLDAHGQPKVTDFGIAKQMANPDGLTLTGWVMGTPAFMAPEQADPKRGPTTVASDVYGIGGILYYLLTRRPPHSASSLEQLLFDILQREVERPREHAPRVPIALQTICLKCLETEPGRRYPTAKAVAADLQRWLDHRPIEARPPSHAERLLRLIGRHPLPAGLSALVVLGSLLSLGILTFSERRTDRAEFHKSMLEVEQTLAREDLPSALRLVEKQLNRSDANRRVAAERLLNGLAFRACLIPWPSPGLSPPTPKDRSNQGSSLAWITNHVDLVIMTKGDASAFRTIHQAHARVIRSVSFSPDGLRLVSAASDGTAKIWEVEGGRCVLTLNNSNALGFAEFSPNGEQVLIADVANIATLYNAQTGQRLAAFSLPAGTGSLNTARFSANGRWIVTATYDEHAVQVWDATTFRAHTPAVRFPCLTDDANCTEDSAAFVGSMISVHRINGDSLTYKLTIPTRWKTLRAARPPDVSVPLSKTVSLGGLLQRIDSPAIGTNASPDARWLATFHADGKVRLWDTTAINAEGRVLSHPAGTLVNCVAFSHDNCRVVTSTARPTQIRVWDVETGLPLTDIIPSDTPVSWVAFSPDDERLLTSAGGTWNFLKVEGRGPRWLQAILTAAMGVSADGLAQAIERTRVLRQSLKGNQEAGPAGRRLDDWAKEWLDDWE